MTADEFVGTEVIARCRGFREVYAELAVAGQADELGSVEYLRVFELWARLGMPPPDRDWIRGQANCPITPAAGDDRRGWDQSP